MIKEAYYNGITKKAATAWKRPLRNDNLWGSVRDAQRTMRIMHRILQYNDKLANRPKPIFHRLMLDKRFRNQLFSAYQDISKDNYDAAYMLLKNPEVADRVKNPYMRNKLRLFALYYNNPGYLRLPRTMKDTSLLSKLMSNARKVVPWIPENKILEKILKSGILDLSKNQYTKITKAWYDDRSKTEDNFLWQPGFLLIISSKNPLL